MVDIKEIRKNPDAFLEFLKSEDEKYDAARAAAYRKGKEREAMLARARKLREDVIDRDDAINHYEFIFGKRPPGNWKTETIRKKIEEKEKDENE